MPIEYLTRRTKAEIRQLLSLDGILFGYPSWTKQTMLFDARERLQDHPELIRRLADPSQTSQISRDAAARAIIDGRKNPRCLEPRSNVPSTPTPLPTYTLHSDEPYMHLPSDDIKRERLQQFINATNNAAIKKLACIACGGYFFASLCHPEPFPLTSIPNPHHLIPDIPHVSHVYTQRMLLERGAISKSPAGIEQGTLCLKCFNALSRNTPPPLALARGFWVGDIPQCLQALTLAERILIQLAFPRVYLVKLRPKKKTPTGATLPIPPTQ